MKRLGPYLEELRVAGNGWKNLGLALMYVFNAVTVVLIVMFLVVMVRMVMGGYDFALVVWKKNPSPVLATLGILVTGGIFYRMKEKWPMTYGILEIVAAGVGGWTSAANIGNFSNISVWLGFGGWRLPCRSRIHEFFERMGKIHSEAVECSRTSCSRGTSITSRLFLIKAGV